MTAHTIRLKGLAKGSKCGDASRIMVSLSVDDFRRLTWLAEKRGVPVTNILRIAVWAYLLPIVPDADAAAGRGPQR